MPVKLKDAVGRRFGKQNQVVVVEYTNSNACKVLCEVCAKDPEMFGEAIFETAFTRLKQDKLPCGCSGNPKWSQQAWRTRLSRECTKRNYTLLGTKDDALFEKYVYLNIYCNICDKIWDTTNASSFMQGVGCTHCESRNIGDRFRVDDNEMVERFKASSMFLPDMEFRRIDRKTKAGFKEYWEYTCPKCSVDEYVENGLCSGKFEIRSADIRRGTAACRCSPNFRWSKEQREYQLRKRLGTDFTFVRWENGYKSIFSPVVLHCTEHGDWITKADSIINAGTRCPDCCKGGFKRNLASWIYVVKVIGSQSFTGYGISNKPRKRLTQHRKHLKIAGCSIEDVTLIPIDGNLAIKIERYLKDTLNPAHPGIPGFIVESSLMVYEDVVNLVELLKGNNDVFSKACSSN